MYLHEPLEERLPWVSPFISSTNSPFYSLDIFMNCPNNSTPLSMWRYQWKILMINLSGFGTLITTMGVDLLPIIVIIQCLGYVIYSESVQGCCCRRGKRQGKIFIGIIVILDPTCVRLYPVQCEIYSALIFVPVDYIRWWSWKKALLIHHIAIQRLNWVRDVLRDEKYCLLMF